MTLALCVLAFGAGLFVGGILVMLSGLMDIARTWREIALMWKESHE
jgi:hypothetical protein